MKNKLKRTLIILFSAVCCVCMAFPLFASYSAITTIAYDEDPYEESWENLPDSEKYNMWNRIRKLYDYIINESYNPSGGGKLKQNEDIEQVKSDMEQVKIQTDVDVSDESATEYITSVPNIIGTLTSKLWDFIIFNICEQDPASSTYLGGTGGAYSTPLTINPLSNTFDGVTKVFCIAAYSLVLIFFSVNIVEQSLKYEIFTIKGSLKIFGRLIVSKVIIDLSTTICGKILGAVGQMVVMVLGEDEYTPFQSFVPKIDLDPCGIKLIGNLIDAYIASFATLSILLIVGTVFIMSLLVVLKLMLRAFELTMLVCTSPVFFACASSDVTKEYFKKFIITFLEVACQTLFMCIALKIGMSAIQSHYADTITNFDKLAEYMETQLPYCIIAIAMCVMMIKPPKVLTNLLKG